MIDKKYLFGIIVVVVIATGGAVVATSSVPTFEVKDIGDVESVSENQTTIESEVSVNNSNFYPIPAGFVGVSYDTSIDGIEIVNGEVNPPSVKSRQVTDVSFNSTIDNRKIPDVWVSYLESNESAQVKLNATIGITSPIKKDVYTASINRQIEPENPPVQSALSESASSLEGNYTRNVSLSDNPLTSGLEIDASVVVGYRVENATMYVKDVEKNRTTLILDMKLRNPSKTVPVPSEPDNLGASIKANEIELVEAEDSNTTTSGDTEQVILPQESKQVKYEVELTNQKIDEWFVSHLENKERTQLDVKFELVFSSEGQEFRIPSDNSSQYSCTIQTNIFYEDKEQSFECD